MSGRSARRLELSTLEVFIAVEEGSRSIEAGGHRVRDTLGVIASHEEDEVVTADMP
jgi:hypothetical protein